MAEAEKAEEGKIQGFDYRSTIRDPKTGKVIKTQHFTHTITPNGEVLRRDGKCYAPNGDEIPDPKLEKVTEQLTGVTDKKPQVQFTKRA